MPTNENPTSFINRVRNNLHVVLCFTRQREVSHARLLPAVFAGQHGRFMAAEGRAGGRAEPASSPSRLCARRMKRNMVETMGVVQDGVGAACQSTSNGSNARPTSPQPVPELLNSYRKLYDQKKTHFENLRLHAYWSVQATGGLFPSSSWPWSWLSRKKIWRSPRPRRKRC